MRNLASRNGLRGPLELKGGFGDELCSALGQPLMEQGNGHAKAEGAAALYAFAIFSKPKTDT